MARTRLARMAAALALAVAARGASGAGGLETPAARVDPDLAKAQKAIDARDWAEALRLLGIVAGREPKNADVHNLLGFAERNRGNLDAAFAHYETALKLDPRHKGAHEYAGEAYLLAGNLARAEEHLAALDKLCFFSCEEYRDLKKSIAEYRRAHPQ
jgi:Flp pilus assembly protein TadD